MTTPPPRSPSGAEDPTGRHTSEAPTCPRHPDRVSYIKCQRCGRPTCPDCQRPAAVGVQCVDCVREGAKNVPTPTTAYGAPAAKRTPLVTYGLIGLCVLVYLGQRTLPWLTGDLSFVGVLGGSQPWRFVTSAFVHSPTSFLHIFFNMYILYAFGPAFEQVLGHVKFLAVYLICAIGGSLGVLLFASPDPGWYVHVVGASGAIFGLLMMYVVLVFRAGQSPNALLVMIGLNLALPFFVGGIAWQAHVGGAITGLVIGGLLVLTSAKGRTPEAVRRRRLMWPALGVLTVILVALAAWRLVSVLGVAAFSIQF